ncbi:MAG: transposase [Acetobacteraceae bacterium]|nr:transposase [Acetobacteraceae bacterium]
MKPKIPEGWIVTGWSGRLYPCNTARTRFNQWSGAQRFLWNRLRDREKAEYAATGKFLWRKHLQPIAVSMKRQSETAWLADLPAHAVLDTVARLDGALRRMVAERKAGRKCGFPKAKKKFVNEAGIYCVGQATSFETRERMRGTETELEARAVVLPKIGRVRLRGGAMPHKHKVLSGRIWRDGDRWMFSAQLAVPRPAPLAASDAVIGIDLGVTTLVTSYDGSDFHEVAAPKRLRKALRRLRRAQRAQSRRKKGSARRRAAGRRVTAIHRRVREQRKDILHKESHRLTTKAGVLKVETLNVRGMARNRHLALSVADAGMARLVTFCRYKADWRGRRVVEIDRWFPGSQTCCKCDALHPEMKMKKGFREMMICECGNRIGRDRNAAVNHYRYPEETGNRGSCAPTRVEIGEQGLAPVPVGETRTLAGVELNSDHESQ